MPSFSAIFSRSRPSERYAHHGVALQSLNVADEDVHRDGRRRRLDTRCLPRRVTRRAWRKNRYSYLKSLCDERLTLLRPPTHDRDDRTVYKTTFAHRDTQRETALGTRRLRATGKFAAREGRTSCSSFVPNAVDPSPEARAGTPPACVRGRKEPDARYRLTFLYATDECVLAGWFGCSRDA